MKRAEAPRANSMRRRGGTEGERRKRKGQEEEEEEEEVRPKGRANRVRLLLPPGPLTLTYHLYDGVGLGLQLPDGRLDAASRPEAPGTCRQRSAPHRTPTPVRARGEGGPRSPPNPPQ